MAICSANRGVVVAVGSVITVSDGEGWAAIYQIVPDCEADASGGRLAEGSALAQAVMGHSIGDEVVVRCPGGRWKAKIEGCTAA